MIEIHETELFTRWFASLRDDRARARINIRIRRLSLGNRGDAKSIGSVHELRIDYGPGYRVYYVERGKDLVVLLWGGDKRTQNRDIERARDIAEKLE